MQLIIKVLTYFADRPFLLIIANNDKLTYTLQVDFMKLVFTNCMVVEDNYNLVY